MAASRLAQGRERAALAETALYESTPHLRSPGQARRRNFSRLRVVPGTELNADALIDTTAEDKTTNATAETEPANQDSGSGDGDVVVSEAMIAVTVGEELALADEDVAAARDGGEDAGGAGWWVGEGIKYNKG
ncbi:hypothetical protein MY11210_000815 [Beauveria gryllotalpidicola]